MPIILGEHSAAHPAGPVGRWRSPSARPARSPSATTTRTGIRGSGSSCLFDATARRSSAAAARCSRRRLPHRGSLRGRRSPRPGTPAPSLARIWFADGPTRSTPPTTAGSCNVGGPYTGYPCASQNATGTPVPHPGWNGELTIPQTSDVGDREDHVVVGAAVELRHGSRPGAAGQRSAKCEARRPGFTIVGYGAQAVKPALVSVLERLLGTVDLMDKKQSFTSELEPPVHRHPGKNQGDGGRTTRRRRASATPGGPLLADTPEAAR